MEKNLGHATAYGYAKSKGYTGTEEEFGVLMASYASVAQDASQSASSAAESAQLASNEAQRASQSATSAHNDAETASNIKTDVESARDTTVDAKNATVEAKNISVEAKNSAISAKDTAESKAQIAEAWAVGQKDGTDVPSTDETYHNNAKYYSEQADIAKIGAESAQQLAQASATSASESASDASTSAQTASQAAQTATSKASEATIAATTATTKASEASTSAGTASTAAQTATNKASEATTAATTATTKASEANQSATSASTAKINAETARDAAAQSASEAVNSAIEAAQSAQSVDAERLNRVAFGSYVTESASGSITSFFNGADSIPMKDVLVHIEPVQAGSGDPSPDNVRPITGWTGAKVTRTGKNRLSLGDTTFTQFFEAEIAEIPAGTYVYSAVVTSTDTDANVCAVIFLDADKRTISSKSLSRSVGSARVSTSNITASVPIKYVRLYSSSGYPSGAGDTATFKDNMIELGSTATDYEPYSGQTYDITFPSEAGTVYGGTLDVTTGELVVDRAIMTLDGTQSLSPNGKTSVSSRFGLSVVGKAVGERNILSNIFYTMPIFVDDVGWVYGRAASNYVEFSLPPDIEQTTAAGKAWFAENPTQLCYELATPITYQLTPQEITSLLGTNNIWADTGDSEVEYRVDPALLLDDELSEVQSMIAGVESSTVATKNYSIGDLVIVGDTLYEVTAAIASGETISASNTVATTVDNVIKNRMITVDNTIRNRIADSIDDTLMVSGKAADAKATGDEIDSLKSTFDNSLIGIDKFSNYAQFEHYGLNSIGEYATNQQYRVSCVQHIKFNRTIKINVKSGFRWGYRPFVNGEMGAWVGWITTERLIQEGTEFIVQIARVTENTSEIADVDEFVSAIVFETAIGERLSNAETGIELINDFQSYELVDRDISGTTSFTLTLDTAIPVGQYGIYVESIQSSDTDNTKSSIAFYNGNTSVFVLDLDRNVEIYKSISLNSSITKIIFFASTGGGSSSGDTFSYNGFKLLQSSNLGKRFDKIESYIGNTKLEYFLNTASPVGSVQSITGEKAYAIDNYIYRADQIVFKSAGSAYDGIQYMIESPIIGKLITVSAKRNTGNDFLIRIINRNASNENISYSIVNGLDGVLSTIVPEGTARTLITIGACWGTAVGTDTVVTFSDIKIMYGNDEYVHSNWTYKGEKISIAESEKTNPCKSTLWKDFKGSEISGLANYSLHLNQSIAIFNDYMFLFNAGGTGVVLDYSTKNILSAISFEPSSRQHANSAQFTDYYYFDGDEFPLLLLSRCGNSASGSGDDECLVYRITRSGSTFTMTLVNSIRPNFATYGASWGIDTNTGLLYLSTYLNGTWQVSTNNPVVFVAFKMPSKTSVLNGTEILLSESDIVAKMFIDHYTLQGMAVDGGTIYTGITYNGQNVWAIDIWKNRITSKIYLQSNYECEGVAIYNGKIYVSQKNGADTTATNPCKVYELEF